MIVPTSRSLDQIQMQHLPDDVFFFGSEHFGGDVGDAASAEERMLLGESDRGLMRRRVVRRSLGSAASSLLSFTERDVDETGGDPLSDLLTHIAASRQAAGEPPSLLRARGVSALSALSSSLAALPLTDEPLAHRPGAPTPAQREQRAAFVEQLLLSSLSDLISLAFKAPAVGAADTSAGAAAPSCWRLDAATDSSRRALE